jgi:hypothetical protein
MATISDTFVGPPPRAVRGLSWGALLLTPLWLLRNGFWLTAAVYVLCSIFIWPIALIIAVVFFFRGTKWSWSKGQRWRSYAEFRTSQFNWEFLALVTLVVAIVIMSTEALFELQQQRLFHG